MLELLGKDLVQSSILILIGLTFMKLSYNKDRHKISEDRTHSGQIRLFTLELLAFECRKSDICLCPEHRSFMFNRNVYKTCRNKSQTTSNSAQIGIFTLELLALKC